MFPFKNSLSQKLVLNTETCFKKSDQIHFDKAQAEGEYVFSL